MPSEMFNLWCARVDVDGGRVAQWNDISHGENHAKQNSAGKPVLFPQTVRPPHSQSHCTCVRVQTRALRSRARQTRVI